MRERRRGGMLLIREQRCRRLTRARLMIRMMVVVAVVMERWRRRFVVRGHRLRRQMRVGLLQLLQLLRLHGGGGEERRWVQPTACCIDENV